MVANVSKTPFTSFFPISFSAAIFSISCAFVIWAAICVLLVDSVPRTMFGKISETYISEDLHSFWPAAPQLSFRCQHSSKEEGPLWTRATLR
jgi:hypothetical protein